MSKLLALFLLLGFHLVPAQELSLDEIRKLNTEALQKVLGVETLDSAYALASKTYSQSKGRFRVENAVSTIPIARYFQMKFNFDTAALLLHSSLDILTEDQPEFLAYAKMYLANNFLLLGDNSQTLKYLQEAEALLSKVDNDNIKLKRNIYNLQVHAHSTDGNYTQALEYCRKILVLSTTPLQRAVAFTQTSATYSNLKDYQKARDFGKKAIPLAKNNLMTLSDVYSVLAPVYSRMGKPDSAIFYYDQLIQATPANRRYHLGSVMSKKGILQYKSGDCEGAIKTFEEAIQAKSKSRFSRDEETDYWYIGTCQLSSGAVNSALRNAHLSLKTSQGKEFLPGISRALSLLSEIHVAKGTLDSAVHYLNLTLAYKDSLFNNETQKKFADLRVEIETLEKQKEIDLLTKQQEIDQAKEEKLQVLVFSISSIAILLAIISFVYYRNRQKKERIKQLELTQAIEKKELELQQQTLHMITLNNSISEVEEKLKEVKKKESVSKQDVQKVLSNITISKSMDKEWQQFESYFSNIHPQFNSLLVEQHTNLTQQERRLTALIRMGLSNREMASLLNIEQRSVIVNRYRLKQKLGLSEDEDLNVYIQKF